MVTREEKDREQIFASAKIGDVINFKHDGRGIVFGKSLFIIRVQLENRTCSSFITRHKIILN